MPENSVFQTTTVDSEETRNQAMASVYLVYGYTLAEIGSELGLHYATMSRIITARDRMS